MSIHGPRRAGRPPGRRWWRWVLLVATVAGLVGMHQLAGAAPATHDAHYADVATARVATPADDCPDHGGECPESPHGHPSQVCQPTPPGTGTPLGEPELPVLVAPRPATPTGVTVGTSADDAANGSGCGPPLRSQLQVLRR